MRIQGSSLNPSSSSTSPSPSSLGSSALNSLSSDERKARCEGLDLLVEAVIHVAGCVVFDIPFTPNNAPMKGKRAFKCKKPSVTEIQEEEEENKVKNKKKDETAEVPSKLKRRKRILALPSKYKDSVLQPWKRRTRRRQSLEIDG